MVFFFEMLNFKKAILRYLFSILYFFFNTTAHLCGR